jgi:hypothetical protein
MRLMGYRPLIGFILLGWRYSEAEFYIYDMKTISLYSRGLIDL